MIFIGADMMNSRWRCRSCPASWPSWSPPVACPPLVVMAGIMLFYVVLGCVMDEMSMILLTVPIIFPVIMGLDFFGLDTTDKAHVVRHPDPVRVRDRHDLRRRWA
jgi:C4-dicarboxylate transporter DctM subunit